MTQICTERTENGLTAARRSLLCVCVCVCVCVCGTVLLELAQSTHPLPAVPLAARLSAAVAVHGAGSAVHAAAVACATAHASDPAADLLQMALAAVERTPRCFHTPTRSSRCLTSAELVGRGGAAETWTRSSSAVQRAWLAHGRKLLQHVAPGRAADILADLGQHVGQVSAEVQTRSRGQARRGLWPSGY